jgi:acetoin utilization deacetylase AcuC-like enzyme
VHQGDGTASILSGDPSIFTLSMHCEQNFPFRKQVSDLDIELAAGADDMVYMSALRKVLPEVLQSFNPDLVLYDAGVDPHHEDLLGKLALTDEGLKQRDRYVLDHCLGRGHPVASVIGGGYSRDILQLARRHSIISQVASDMMVCHSLVGPGDTLVRQTPYDGDSREADSGAGGDR